MKKHFFFEKWWLQKESFVKVVEKASNIPCPVSSSLDVWKIKLRALKRLVKAWAMNEVASLNRYKSELALKYNDLDAEMENTACLQLRALGWIL